MTGPERRIEAILAGHDQVIIPIRDDDGQIIGRLEPITRRHVGDEALAERLSRWRNGARQAFLTQFQAKAERTAAWIRNVVAPDSTRLLMIIHSPKKAVGHLGFRDLKADRAELDNLVRGELGGHPWLIHHAEASLLRWMFDELDLKTVTARIFADNEAPIAIHRELGFEEVGVEPMVGVFRGVAETHFVPIEEAGPEPAGEPRPRRNVCNMRLSHQAFRRSKNP